MQNWPTPREEQEMRIERARLQRKEAEMLALAKKLQMKEEGK